MKNKDCHIYFKSKKVKENGCHYVLGSKISCQIVKVVLRIIDIYMETYRKVNQGKRYNF